MVELKDRLLNFLVDCIVIFLFSAIAVTLILGIASFLIKNGYVQTDGFSIDTNILFLPCYIIYYFSMESFTGKTVGKMITKTRVVSSNGNQASVFS
ncbi:MAG: RDD family protein, partial [Bacteroidota bacterium]